MCGRYALSSSPQRIVKAFDAQLTPDLLELEPRHNIAPTKTLGKRANHP